MSEKIDNWILEKDEEKYHLRSLNQRLLEHITKLKEETKYNRDFKNEANKSIIEEYLSCLKVHNRT